MGVPPLPSFVACILELLAINFKHDMFNTRQITRNGLYGLFLAALWVFSSQLNGQSFAGFIGTKTGARITITRSVGPMQGWPGGKRNGEWWRINIPIDRFSFDVAHGSIAPLIQIGLLDDRTQTSDPPRPLRTKMALIGAQWRLGNLYLSTRATVGLGIGHVTSGSSVNLNAPDGFPAAFANYQWVSRINIYDRNYLVAAMGLEASVWRLELSWQYMINAELYDMSAFHIGYRAETVLETYLMIALLFYEYARIY